MTSGLVSHFREFQAPVTNAPKAQPFPVSRAAPPPFRTPGGVRVAGSWPIAASRQPREAERTFVTAHCLHELTLPSFPDYGPAAYLRRRGNALGLRNRMAKSSLWNRFFFII